MRLSLMCFFKKTVPGHIFRGKRRLVKPVTRRAMNSLIEDFNVQEKNMSLLRYPYLTLAESAGHAKALEKQQTYFEQWRVQRVEHAMKPHVTIEERLECLKVNDKWD